MLGPDIFEIVFRLNSLKLAVINADVVAEPCWIKKAEASYKD